MEFLRAIRDRITSRAGSEPELDHHFNTQVPFAFDMQTPYDEVYDISKLTVALKKINFRYGFTFVPGVRRPTKYAKFNGEFLGGVSSVDLARGGARLNKENFVSSETQQLTQDAYAIDFRDLGYK